MSIENIKKPVSKQSSVTVTNNPPVRKLTRPQVGRSALKPSPSMEFKPKQLKQSQSFELKKPTRKFNSKTKIIGNTLEAFKSVLESKSSNDRELREALKALRFLIIKRGLPVKDNGASRPKVWKALLGIYKISSAEYISLVKRGASPLSEKIQNDVFRTLATDDEFQKTVSNDMLTRLLNAFVWKAMDQPSSRLMNLRFTYVQGMNVLAAPFLYVLPELDAFFSYSSFLQSCCPLYVQPALEGVHCGVKLVDNVLEVVDPVLFKHLMDHNLVAQVYAFPYVMTFCACIAPLDQVLILWDYYFAFGVHLNIIAIIAQLILIKDQIMLSSSPMKLLRTLPNLDAKKILAKTLEIVNTLDEDLYDLLVRHPFDPIIYDAMLPDEV